MKYLYKGMGLPGWGDVSGSVLLGWHEKARPATPSMLLWKLIVARLLVDGGSGHRLYRQGHDRQKDHLITQGIASLYIIWIYYLNIRGKHCK